MYIAQIENLTKSYGDKKLFHDLNFGIDEHDKIGLIGLNGTGKSSLIKVIAGIDAPDAGQVHFYGSKRIEYLSQDPEFDDQLSVIDTILKMDSPEMRLIRDYEAALFHLNAKPADKKAEQAFLALSQRIDDQQLWNIQSQVESILSRLGILAIERKISELSGGQRKRVALAAALLSDCDLLILDEPTNHLDNETIDWLENFLLARSGALLLITHDRYFLDRIVTKTLELDRGTLYEYEGNYASYLELKAGRQEMDQASEKKRQNLYRQELAWIRRGARARSTKQKARIERFEALENQAVDLKENTLSISMLSRRLGKKVIELKNVSKRFESCVILDDFSLLIGPGERLGIIGKNGLGKSTLLNLIAGQVSPDRGQIIIGETVRIGYFSQESADMNQDQKAIEYIREKAELIKDTDGHTLTASQMMETFLFDKNKQWVEISKLSGGEQRRLYLMAVLVQRPNVLLLDEPTNDLDLETLAILEDYLDQFSGSVISVSHDRYFLDRTSDKILAFKENGITSLQTGNYSDYLAKKALQDKACDSSKTKKVMVKDQAPRPRKGLTYKEKIEYADLKKEFPLLETRLDGLILEMNAAGSDYLQLESLNCQKEALEEKMLDQMDRLEELKKLTET